MKKWAGRTSRRSKISAGRTRIWRRNWSREDHPLCWLTLSIGHSPPLSTQERLKRPRTRPPLRRWMVSPVLTSWSARPTPWIRCVDTLSPILLSKFHCRINGKVSTGIAIMAWPIQMSTWMRTLCTWTCIPRTIRSCVECFPRRWREEILADSQSSLPTSSIASRHWFPSSRHSFVNQNMNER